MRRPIVISCLLATAIVASSFSADGQKLNKKQPTIKAKPAKPLPPTSGISVKKPSPGKPSPGPSSATAKKHPVVAAIKLKASISTKHMAKLPGDEDLQIDPFADFQKTTPRAVANNLGVDHLGHTFDDHFEYVGGSIFENPSHSTTTLNKIETEYMVIQDTLSFALNASAWGIASADVGYDTSKRYMALRSFNIIDMLTINDEKALSQQAPKGAVYYLWRVYRGHMVETLIQGNASSFNAGVQAKLLSFLDLGVGVKTYVKKSNLQMKTQAWGATYSSGQSAFQLPDGEEAPYTMEGVEPVVIFAQYRVIPGRFPAPIYKIDFPKPNWKKGKYGVTAVSATILGTKSDSSSWDFNDPVPDVYMNVYKNECIGANYLFTTSTISGSMAMSEDGLQQLYKSTWNSSEDVNLVPNDKLCVVLNDADSWSGNDYIGSCDSPPIKDLDSPIIELQNCDQAQSVVIELSPP